MSLSLKKNSEYYEEIRAEKTKRLNKLKEKIYSKTNDGGIFVTDFFESPQSEQYELKTINASNFDQNLRRRNSSRNDETASLSFFGDFISTESATEIDSTEVSVEENTLEMYCYTNYSEIIGSHLKESVYSTLAKVTMEFITLNVYSLMKNQMRRCFLGTLKEYMIEENVKFEPETAAKLIQLKMKMIEENTTQRMLDEADLNTWIDSSAKQILYDEHLELKAAVLSEAKTIFDKLFLDSPKKAKIKLNLITPSGLDNDYSNLNQKSAASDLASPTSGYLRLFGKYLLFKLYFPSLVYKADMTKPSKYKIIRDLLQQGTSLNRSVKSLTGLFFALIFTYLIYSYFRLDILVIRNLLVAFIFEFLI
jgi:hypothetical protein